jgi:hypothetical protein
MEMKDNQMVPNKNTSKGLPSRKTISGKDKKITTTAHQCKYPSNHCIHCNIDGNTKYKYWKIDPEKNPKNCKKEAKKKNVLVVDLGN